MLNGNQCPERLQQSHVAMELLSWHSWHLNNCCDYYTNITHGMVRSLDISCCDWPQHGNYVSLWTLWTLCHVHGHYVMVTIAQHLTIMSALKKVKVVFSDARELIPCFKAHTIYRIYNFLGLSSGSFRVCSTLFAFSSPFLQSNSLHKHAIRSWK